MKKSRFARPIAAALAFVYLFTNCAFAHQTESTLWAERRKSLSTPGEKPDQLASLPFALNQFPAVESQSRIASAEWRMPRLPKGSRAPYDALVAALSPAFGTVRKISVPPAARPRKILIHIQDVHLNPEAQENIGRTVQELIDGKKVELIALEGAFAPIDLASFRVFSDHGIVRNVADALLRENKISGPVHAAFVSPSVLPPLVGVDDPVHYRANVAAYRASAPHIKEVKKRLEGERNRLSEEKSRTFNAALAAFDAKVQSYRAGRLAMSAYAQALAKRRAKNTPAIENFVSALRMESSLNFARIESERTALVETLVKKLDASAMSELASAGAAFRLGNQGPADFYAYLQTVCEKNGVRLSTFPAMSVYLHYVLLAESIDAERLFADMRELEEKTYAALARTPEEKELVAASRLLFLRGKLADFALTREEWDEYRNYKSQITKSIIQTNDHDSNFESFYAEADARDQAMAENLLRAMNDQKISAAVLVTGGFHSTGIDRRMNDAGVTTITYVPKITEVDSENGSAYLSVFTREKTPLDKLFEGETLFLSPEQAPISLRRYAATLCAAIGAITGTVPIDQLKMWLAAAWRTTSASLILAGRFSVRLIIGNRAPLTVRFSDDRYLAEDAVVERDHSLSRTARGVASDIIVAATLTSLLLCLSSEDIFLSLRCLAPAMVFIWRFGIPKDLRRELQRELVFADTRGIAEVMPVAGTGVIKTITGLAIFVDPGAIERQRNAKGRRAVLNKMVLTITATARRLIHRSAPAAPIKRLADLFVQIRPGRYLLDNDVAQSLRFIRQEAFRDPQRLREPHLHQSSGNVEKARNAIRKIFERFRPWSQAGTFFVGALSRFTRTAFFLRMEWLFNRKIAERLMAEILSAETEGNGKWIGFTRAALADKYLLRICAHEEFHKLMDKQRADDPASIESLNALTRSILKTGQSTIVGQNDDGSARSAFDVLVKASRSHPNVTLEELWVMHLDTMNDDVSPGMSDFFGNYPLGDFLALLPDETSTPLFEAIDRTLQPLYDRAKEAGRADIRAMIQAGFLSESQAARIHGWQPETAAPDSPAPVPNAITYVLDRLAGKSHVAARDRALKWMWLEAGAAVGIPALAIGSALGLASFNIIEPATAALIILGAMIGMLDLLLKFTGLHAKLYRDLIIKENRARGQPEQLAVPSWREAFFHHARGFGLYFIFYAAAGLLAAAVLIFPSAIKWDLATTAAAGSAEIVFAGVAVIAHWNLDRKIFDAFSSRNNGNEEGTPPAYSIWRALHHSILSGWKGENVRRFPLLASDHKILFVLSYSFLAILFLCVGPILLRPGALTPMDALLIAGIPAAIGSCWYLAKDHYQESRDAALVARNARYLLHNPNAPLDPDIEPLIARFETQTGWRIDWIESDTVLAQLQPLTRKVRMMAGWRLANGDLKESIRSTAYLRHVLRTIAESLRENGEEESSQNTDANALLAEMNEPDWFDGVERRLSDDLRQHPDYLASDASEIAFRSIERAGVLSNRVLAILQATFLENEPLDALWYSLVGKSAHFYFLGLRQWIVEIPLSETDPAWEMETRRRTAHALAECVFILQAGALMFALKAATLDDATRDQANAGLEELDRLIAANRSKTIAIADVVASGPGMARFLESLPIVDGEWPPHENSQLALLSKSMPATSAAMLNLYETRHPDHGRLPLEAQFGALARSIERGPASLKENETVGDALLILHHVDFLIFSHACILAQEAFSSLGISNFMDYYRRIREKAIARVYAINRYDFRTLALHFKAVVDYAELDENNEPAHLAVGLLLLLAPELLTGPSKFDGALPGVRELLAARPRAVRRGLAVLARRGGHVPAFGTISAPVIIQAAVNFLRGEPLVTVPDLWMRNPEISWDELAYDRVLKIPGLHRAYRLAQMSELQNTASSSNTLRLLSVNTWNVSIVLAHSAAVVLTAVIQWNHGLSLAPFLILFISSWIVFTFVIKTAIPFFAAAHEGLHAETAVLFGDRWARRYFSLAGFWRIFFDAKRHTEADWLSMYYRAARLEDDEDIGLRAFFGRFIKGTELADAGVRTDDSDRFRHPMKHSAGAIFWIALAGPAVTFFLMVAGFCGALGSLIWMAPLAPAFILLSASLVFFAVNFYFLFAAVLDASRFGDRTDGNDLLVMNHTLKMWWRGLDARVPFAFRIAGVSNSREPSREQELASMDAGARWLASLYAAFRGKKLDVLLKFAPLDLNHFGQATPKDEAHFHSQLSSWLENPDFIRMLRAYLPAEDRSPRANAADWDMFVAIAVWKGQRNGRLERLLSTEDVTDSHLFVFRAAEHHSPAAIAAGFLAAGMWKPTTILADESSLPDVNAALVLLKTYGFSTSHLAVTLDTDGTLDGPRIEPEKIAEWMNHYSLIVLPDAMKPNGEDSRILAFTEIIPIGTFDLATLALRLRRALVAA